MHMAEILQARQHDLGGGFVVRRLLPSAQRQAVGPFVFFDHFGPVQAQPGDNHDVRPHPHIGLSTVTYLFEGAMMHRDSTGAVQRMACNSGWPCPLIRKSASRPLTTLRPMQSRRCNCPARR